MSYWPHFLPNGERLVLEAAQTKRIADVLDLGSNSTERDPDRLLVEFQPWV
ncbi:MAG: hypothetical protein ACK4X1_13550 [Terricaulis sp.]